MRKEINGRCLARQVSVWEPWTWGGREEMRGGRHGGGRALLGSRDGRSPGLDPDPSGGSVP